MECKDENSNVMASPRKWHVVMEGGEKCSSGTPFDLFWAVSENSFIEPDDRQAHDVDDKEMSYGIKHVKELDDNALGQEELLSDTKLSTTTLDDLARTGRSADLSSVDHKDIINSCGTDNELSSWSLPLYEFNTDDENSDVSLHSDKSADNYQSDTEQKVDQADRLDHSEISVNHDEDPGISEKDQSANLSVSMTCNNADISNISDVTLDCSADKMEEFSRMGKDSNCSASYVDYVRSVSTRQWNMSGQSFQSDNVIDLCSEDSDETNCFSPVANTMSSATSQQAATITSLTTVGEESGQPLYPNNRLAPEGSRSASLDISRYSSVDATKITLPMSDRFRGGGVYPHMRTISRTTSGGGDLRHSVHASNRTRSLLGDSTNTRYVIQNWPFTAAAAGNKNDSVYKNTLPNDDIGNGILLQTGNDVRLISLLRTTDTDDRDLHPGDNEQMKSLSKTGDHRLGSCLRSDYRRTRMFCQADTDNHGRSNLHTCDNNSDRYQPQCRDTGKQYRSQCPDIGKQRCVLQKSDRDERVYHSGHGDSSPMPLQPPSIVSETTIRERGLGSVLDRRVVPEKENMIHNENRPNTQRVVIDMPANCSTKIHVSSIESTSIQHQDTEKDRVSISFQHQSDAPRKPMCGSGRTRLQITRRKLYSRYAGVMLSAEEALTYLGHDPDKKYSISCKKCDSDFKSATDYLNHSKKEHQAYVCHDCGRSFRFMSGILDHRPSHTLLHRFACSVCKKSFSLRSACYKHLSAYHERYGIRGKLVVLELLR